MGLPPYLSLRHLLSWGKTELISLPHIWRSLCLIMRVKLGWSPFMALFLGKTSGAFLDALVSSRLPSSPLIDNQISWTPSSSVLKFWYFLLRLAFSTGSQGFRLITPSTVRYSQVHVYFNNIVTLINDNILTELIVCFVKHFDTGLDCYHSQYSFH